MDVLRSVKKLKTQDWVFLVFSVIWMVVIILDYLNKQQIYLPSIQYFRYSILFTFLGLIGLIISASYTRNKWFGQWRSIPVNGLLAFAIILLTVISVTYSYNQYWKAPLDYSYL